ncbi:hypothetical protein C2S52_009053 [Perilla frutescens var. hirtella]|nr:hypothetical protein C2S52_009053 [Perilla frutescens var. hirtella]
MVVDQMEKSGEEINGPDDSDDHPVTSQRFLGFKAETISSAIDQKSLKHIIQAYGIACQLKVRVPKSSERACWPPRDAIAVYSDIFKRGVRLPLHNFFRKIAASYGISPAQISPNGYNHMMGVHKKHKPQGILLKRIQRALNIPKEYQIKAKADEVKDKSSKEGALGSATPSGGRRPSNVPPSKKARTSTLAPNPTPHTTPAREKPDSVVVVVGFISPSLADGPTGPMLDELGNEIVPRNLATFDPSSIFWSKIQNEMVAVDIGNLQAAGLKSQIARALNHSVQPKLKAEVAVLKTEVEKVKRGKAKAEKKAATAMEESETYKSRLSKVNISHAKMQKEFDAVKDHYKSELVVRDKALDAAKKGEGIDLQKIADSEAFQSIRADMEMKIAECLVGMKKDKNPDLDLSFLYGDDAT